MKPLTFFEDVFEFRVHLLVPCTRKQFSQYAHKIIGERVDISDAGGICLSTIDHVVVGIQDWDGGDAHDIATLSHELIHAASQSLLFRGIKPGPETEEVMAYLQGSLLRRSLQLLGVK